MLDSLRLHAYLPLCKEVRLGGLGVKACVFAQYVRDSEG